MPLTPGRSNVPKRGCVPVENRIDALMNIVNEFGVGPSNDPTDPVVTPVLANEDGDLVDPDGNIIVGGTAYTGGCGISVAGTVISAAVDGSSIICSGGVLTATGSPSVAIVEGPGIDITGGDTIEASIDTTKGLEFLTDKIAVKAGEGIHFVSNAVQFDASVIAGAGLEFGIYDNAETMYVDLLDGGGLVYDDSLTVTPGDDDALVRVKQGDYIEVDSRGVSVEVTEHTLWTINPLGPHTLTVSGDEVTISIAISKYTMQVVGTPTIAADTVEITHTGNECA